jgi:uncharacterized SAM-dependent methyltransferase
MNAFSGTTMLQGTELKRPYHMGGSSKPESRAVAQFWPGSDSVWLDRDGFKKALYATLSHQAEGAISPYLFYDPPGAETGDVNYRSDWGSKDNVPYGAPGWDAHIAESTGENPDKEKKNDYSFADGDQAVIATALQEGLLSHLPRRIAYYSYGPGELIAVNKKDFQILDAVEKAGNYILTALNAVDINDRYALSFAQAANDRYNKAASAVQGNFMDGVLNLGAKDGTSVIGIFGGPFANAPEYKEIDAKTNAARYLAQLVSQHGEGTRVINTIDTESNPDILLSNYKATRRFEAFILGALPRAVHEGIITNKEYDVFGNWKLSTAFDEARRAVKLIAKAKKQHTLKTEDYNFKIRKDEEFVFTLSHKWNEQDWKEIYNLAGLDDLKFYGEGTRKLLVARAARDPDPKLTF